MCHEGGNRPIRVAFPLPDRFVNRNRRHSPYHIRVAFPLPDRFVNRNRRHSPYLIDLPRAYSTEFPLPMPQWLSRGIPFASAPLVWHSFCHIDLSTAIGGIPFAYAATLPRFQSANLLILEDHQQTKLMSSTVSSAVNSITYFIGNSMKQTIAQAYHRQRDWF